MDTNPTSPPPTRGRPRTITPERIADAGIALQLPNITLVGIANALGVTQMALYRHVANLDALKRLVAEAIFQRWQIPRARTDGHGGLQDYLMTFIASLCELAKANPGLPPYLLRRSVATPPMLDKIAAHQAHVAAAFGLPVERARWLLSTIAFYCIAGADTVYSLAGDPVDASTDAARSAEQAEMLAEFHQGMHALVTGSLIVLRDHQSVGA